MHPRGPALRLGQDLQQPFRLVAVEGFALDVPRKAGQNDDRGSGGERLGVRPEDWSEEKKEDCGGTEPVWNSQKEPPSLVVRHAGF